MNDDRWCILIISLPGQSGTPRMRVWRALKARGAGILRDGVYVLPESEETRAVLQEQVGNVQGAGGTAYLLTYSSDDSGLGTEFRSLFDRSAEYDEWLAKVAELIDGLAGLDEPEARRKEAQLRRDFDALAGTDYFPGKPKVRAAQALLDMAAAVNTRFSPDEPTARLGSIKPRATSEFRGRRWATRRNLWVDRVASAWLIRRFIDPEASFVWLAHPRDCPPDAIGFDFDGATFSHVENLVTFEVLLRTFELAENPALAKLGALVHYLDVGGMPVAEAAGFVTMLAGVKHQCSDDDALLDAAGTLLNHLYVAYAQAASTGGAQC